MIKEEIQAKIQTLIESGQGENTYIGVYMMVNHLGLTLNQALASLKPMDYQRNYANPNDFYCSVRIANVWIEYEYIEGYVPYMGTAATASRMVSFFNKERLEIIDGLAEFLAVKDEHSVEDVRQIVAEDYQSLIPTIIDLLGD
ncbi:hypothetical protein [Aureispira anguillae]|uniref:Uncharacterized protein n=1 Tax=Aureispira anguillae TaxID=2864201 RepID=A0A915VKH9_9BACT|nr:hypothetical protein [Aureispira anguillae]BDS09686.1 hypothetical protein AsAng_0003900 [Aureispira anguillae]